MNILEQARELGRTQQLPYAGAVTPAQAFQLLQENETVVLIDVRTQAERDWVGRVQISEHRTGSVQWSLYPGGVPNPDFLAQLKHLVPQTDTPILFLCRSGVRSRHAAKAATEAGYSACFDILEGFEGDKDEQGHRKRIGGWCARGLPWVGA